MSLTWHPMIGSLMSLFRPLSFERPLRSYPKLLTTTHREIFLVVSPLQWLSQRLCLSFLLFRQSPLRSHFLLEASLFDLRLSSESKQRQRNRAQRLNPKEKLRQLQPKPLKLFPRNRFTRVSFFTYVSNVESNNRNLIFLF